MNSPAAQLGKVSLDADAELPGLRTRCAHSEKYEISTTGEPVPQFPYPSRLGFVHSAESGVSIRYVDLNKKLCRDCCDAIVPGGKYFAWSILAGISAADIGAAMAKLTPSDAFYPPIHLAGSESDAVVHPIPDTPGAKEAWQWLEVRGKPFYIDQLHLPVGRGMTPLARKRVAKDSAVALRYGEVVTLDLIRESSKPKSHEAVETVAQSGKPPKTKTASEKRPSKKTSTKASRKTLTATEGSEIELLPEEPSGKAHRMKSPIEKPKSATHEPKTAKTLTGKSSTKGAKADGPEPETTSTIKTTSKSAGKKQESSSVINLTSTTMTVSQQQNLTPSIPVTTSMATRTFTRSWGWSEPFEFTTTGRKVPALSDYERVAESRVLKTPETKSLAHFLQTRLELEAAPKLRGPGEINEITHASSGKDSSTKIKKSASSLQRNPKVSSSAKHAEEPPMAKSIKDSEAHSKSKKLSSSAKLSGSSTDVKTVKPHEMSTKAFKEESSHQGKQSHSGASSKPTHSAGEKVKQKHVSQHSAKSKSKASEVHSKMVKTKETSEGPGSLGGVLKAGLSRTERKIRDAATKPSEQKKHKQRTSSVSKPKPHVKPHSHHSNSSDSEDSAHTGAKPPKPNQTEQFGSDQPSTQTDPTVDAQPSSQVDVPVQSGPPAVTDTPGQEGSSDQIVTPVQANTSNLANMPPQAATSPFTGTESTPVDPANTPANSTDLPPTTSGGSNFQNGTAQLNDADEGQTVEDNSIWPGAQIPMRPEPQLIQSVQAASGGQGQSYGLNGSKPLPNDTGLSSFEGMGHIDLNTASTAILSTKPTEEAAQHPQPTPGSSNAEVGSHPSPSDGMAGYNGKDQYLDAKPSTSGQGSNNGASSSFDTAQTPNEPVAHEPSAVPPGSLTTFPGSGAADQPWKGEASSYYDTKQGVTPSTSADANGSGHKRISVGESTHSKKPRGEAARHSQDHGKHELQSHGRKPGFTKPSKGAGRKHNGHISGATAGLAGLAVGATIGYASAEILMEKDSDSSSDSGSDSNSGSDSDNNGAPSQDGNSDDSDCDADDGVASQSGDGLSDDGSMDGEGEIEVDSDSESDHNGSPAASGTDLDSDNEDSDIDGPTESESSEGEVSDAEQDNEHEGDGSQASSDEEHGNEEDSDEQGSSGPEDDDSSGSEASDIEDDVSDVEEENADTEEESSGVEEEPSEIEEDEPSDPETSDVEGYDSD